MRSEGSHRFTGLSPTPSWLPILNRGSIRRIREEEKLWTRIFFVEEFSSSPGYVQGEAEPTFGRALLRVGAQRSGWGRAHPRVESRQKRRAEDRCQPELRF